MLDNNSLMVISDDEQDIKELDEDESRLYIDENIFDSMNHCNQRSSKSTNTGNAFELDLILLANFYRYRTRSCQTILTSDTSLLVKRNRSTCCQAEYFSTTTNETNTNNYYHEEQEERVLVVKKIRT